MGALRQTIVASVCRVLSVADRGYARRKGNIVDILVDAGLDARLVLQEAAGAVDVRVVTDRLLNNAPVPWPEGTDVAGCLQHGIVAMTTLRSGAWCFAYTDPEVAADAARYAARLRLPPHRIVLALRKDLAPFIVAAEPEPDPFQPTPTEVIATADHGTLDEVSADSEVFDPSAVDGAPIAPPAPPHRPSTPHKPMRFADDDDARPDVDDAHPDVLGGDTMHDGDAIVDDDNNDDDGGGAGAGRDDARPVQPSLQAGDDDDEFYVDTSDRIAPLAKAALAAASRPAPKPPLSPQSLPPPAPSVARPRAATTTTSLKSTTSSPSLKPPAPTTTTTKKPATRRPDRGDTGNTGSAPSPPPAWKDGPPQPLELSRSTVLVAAAVVVVIIGFIVSRRTGLLEEKPPPAAIIVSPDGTVNAVPAQEDLVAQAMAPGVAPGDAIDLLSKAISFDPESRVGLEAIQARLRLLIAQADVARARRDLETLERRTGSDPKAAPMLQAFRKSVEEIELTFPPMPPIDPPSPDQLPPPPSAPD
jgi:hypothetical protein